MAGLKERTRKRIQKKAEESSGFISRMFGTNPLSEFDREHGGRTQSTPPDKRRQAGKSRVRNQGGTPTTKR